MHKKCTHTAPLSPRFSKALLKVRLMQTVSAKESAQIYSRNARNYRRKKGLYRIYCKTITGYFYMCTVIRFPLDLNISLKKKQVRLCQRSNQMQQYTMSDLCAHTACLKLKETYVLWRHLHSWQARSIGRVKKKKNWTSNCVCKFICFNFYTELKLLVFVIWWLAKMQLLAAL